MKFSKLYKLVVDQGWKPATAEERTEVNVALLRKAEAVIQGRHALQKHVFTSKLLRSGKTSKFDALAKDPGIQAKGRPWVARLHSPKTEARGIAVTDGEYQLKVVTKRLQGAAA